MNRYKEPAAKAKKTKHFEIGERNSSRNSGTIKNSKNNANNAIVKSSVKKVRLQRGDSFESLNAFDTVRAIRQSTKEKTVDSDVARKKAFKVKIKSRPPLRHQFSQKELLLDALETEVRERFHSFQ